MKKNKIDFVQDDLFCGKAPPKPPKVEKDERLFLTIEGEGKNVTEKFVFLLRRLGLARAMKLCKERDVYANKSQGQWLVDSKCGTPKSFYKKILEDGKTFFVYTQTDTKTKKAQLAKLSAAR